jgi:hypothetical protein
MKKRLRDRPLFYLGAVLGIEFRRFLAAIKYVS